MAAKNLVVTNQAKADLMAAHYSSRMVTEESERQPLQLTPLCNLHLDDILVTENVMTRYQRNVNTRKAPGPDGVSPFLLKHRAWEVLKSHTHIFQQCLRFCTWPIAWKEVRVTLVYKKMSKLDPSNYHSISLSSIVSKKWSGSLLSS